MQILTDLELNTIMVYTKAHTSRLNTEHQPYLAGLLHEVDDFLLARHHTDTLACLPPQHQLEIGSVDTAQIHLQHFPSALRRSLYSSPSLPKATPDGQDLLVTLELDLSRSHMLFWTTFDVGILQKGTPVLGYLDGLIFGNVDGAFEAMGWSGHRVGVVDLVCNWGER